MTKRSIIMCACTLVMLVYLVFATAGTSGMAQHAPVGAARISVADSMHTGFITAEDEAGTIDTPNGKVDFIKLIGVTDAELKAIMAKTLRVQELAGKIGDLTDYTRESIVLGGRWCWSTAPWAWESRRCAGSSWSGCSPGPIWTATGAG